MSPLFTEAQRERLLENGRRSAAGEQIDPEPVVKLFTPDAGCTWLLTELDPDDPDIAFGLCDPGMGFPELGSVRISELENLRGKLGLPVERDIHWTPNGLLAAYVDAAFRAGHIVDEIEGAGP